VTDPNPGATTCPWCEAAAPPGADRCSSCGAALAQREGVGDLRIPGLTSVDPALEDFDKRPLQIRGPSPSQGVASALIIGAAAGGPIGLAAIGGVAAVAGAEFLGTRIGGPRSPAREDVGRPSEVAWQALQHAGETDPVEPDTSAADDGMSIWRDLPATSEEPDRPAP
jgi:hypothetical protein